MYGPITRYFVIMFEAIDDTFLSYCCLIKFQLILFVEFFSVKISYLSWKHYYLIKQFLALNAYLLVDRLAIFRSSITYVQAMCFYFSIFSKITFNFVYELKSAFLLHFIALLSLARLILCDIFSTVSNIHWNLAFLDLALVVVMFNCNETKHYLAVPVMK